MTVPPWPAEDPGYGSIILRGVEARDAEMARELSTDPYVPLTGTLPGDADRAEAEAWVVQQQGRHAEGRGFSFTIARRCDDRAVGHCGLWLKDFADGRANAGYAVVPSARRRGYAADALIALTNFAWTLPGLQRVELFIEPGNTGSLRTAGRAGYVRQTVLTEHQEIGGIRRDMVLFTADRPPG
jgi:ribosomal-protein-alanine N-acetyltransferase